MRRDGDSTNTRWTKASSKIRKYFGKGSLLSFAIKWVFRRKFLALLSSSGIGFGLMLIFVLGAFNAGVRAQFQSNISQAIGVVEVVELNHIGASSVLPPSILDTLLHASFADQIEATNVEVQLPSGFTTPYFNKTRNSGDTITIKGLNQSLDSKWGGPTSAIQAGGRVFTSNSNQTIVDSRLPGVTQFSLQIGGNFTMYLQSTPTGTTYNLTITGIYNQPDIGLPNFIAREYFLYIDIQKAWSILSSVGYSTPYYTAIYLRFPATTLNDSMVYINQIKALSDQGAFGSTKVDAFTPAQFVGLFEQAFSILDSFSSIITLITLLAGSVSIVDSQLMSVLERTKEFAVLKAIGWKNRHILADVLYESLIKGLLGAFIGMLVGELLILALTKDATFSGIAAVALVTPTLVFEMIFIALTIGTIGGIYPAIKAGRERPVVVLHGE